MVVPLTYSGLATANMPPHSTACSVQVLQRLCGSAQRCLGLHSSCQQASCQRNSVAMHATRMLCSAPSIGLQSSLSRQQRETRSTAAQLRQMVIPHSPSDLSRLHITSCASHAARRPLSCPAETPRATSNFSTGAALQRGPASCPPSSLAYSAVSGFLSHERRALSTQAGDGPRDREPWLSPYWSSYRVKRCVKPPAAALGRPEVAVDDRPHLEQGLVRGAMLLWTEKSCLQLQRRAQIMWDGTPPRTVFIVKKPGSKTASALLREMAHWLQSQGLRVLVERPVHRSEFPEFQPYDPIENGTDVDFCVTLGGDGTVLHLASLFIEDEPLPPVVSFSLGTLGFLTPFDASEYRPCLERVLGADETHPVFCTLRTRKRCEVHVAGRVQRVHHVLNECLIDRGASPSMVTLEAYIDGHHITTVQADGLIIATPSGSTAYNMAAGGPMVAPSVPCTLLTPIAPHSLSFRPIAIPESSDIQIHVPLYARSHARASFDGRHTMRMLRDSSIRCTTSVCALPCISLGPLDADWYKGIVQKLKWNVPIRDVEPPSLVPPALPRAPEAHKQLPPVSLPAEAPVK